MALKEDWKKAGKDIGHAFKSTGKSLGKTLDVAFDDDQPLEDEEGKPVLKSNWSETGKSFGEAGKSIGKATSHTAKKVFKDEPCEEKKEESKKPEESDVVDVDSKEKTGD